MLVTHVVKKKPGATAGAGVGVQDNDLPETKQSEHVNKILEDALSNLPVIFFHPFSVFWPIFAYRNKQKKLLWNENVKRRLRQL